MLNSFEIEELLIQSGFRLVGEYTHALGFSCSELSDAQVYLKDGRNYRNEPRKAVQKQPLVVHRDIGRMDGFDALRVGRLSPNMQYKNDNMGAFRIGEGSKATGIAVDIEHADDLYELLGLMGLKRYQKDAQVDFPTAEQDIAEATDLPDQETERKAVIAARRGQGLFRALLDDHWRGCAVTGCATRALLRASHIQPWRESSNTDRLNPDNGLLLAVHLDAAFDQGLISFADDGCILINDERLPADEADVVGILPSMKLRRVQPAHLPFLMRHRQMHSFPSNERHNTVTLISTDML